MSEVNKKDHAKLIGTINKKTADWGDPKSVGYTRVYIKDASPALLDFYKRNRDEIDADVLFVEHARNESEAATARNANGFRCHTVLVFSDKHFVSTYFSSTFDLIGLPKALLKRVNSAYKTMCS